MGSMSTERPHSTESTKSSSNTTGNAADTITAAAAAVLNGQPTPGSSSLVMGKTTSAGSYHLEETPNHLVYRKMEQIIERMQDDAAGVPVRTVKTFMNKIPSVFSGNDLVLWMIKNLDVTDQMEALHLAHLVAAHGYFFPVEDHVLTVKNDGTLYRFQTPYFWPSNCWEPENTDYAVYLCKRTMQNKARLELADYEAENLARLQKMFSRKWEFIFMQAEAQSRVDKKRDKLERKVLDSQERAFWDVHRPVPGCVNTTEMDIKKACRMHRPIKSTRHLSIGVAGGRVSPSLGDQDPEGNPIILAQKEIEGLRKRLARTNTKVSKVAESFISYFEQYVEYDPFLTPSDPLNPWVSDTVDFWEQDKQGKEIQAKRVKRWGFSLQELLKDPVGHEHFVKFLEKEFSSENLKFWEAVQRLKMLPQSQVVYRGRDIWAEFLASDATCPVNVDSKSHEATRIAMENPDRWTFDRAVAHVYHLMRSDSYSRYLRSEMYKEILSGSKKKSSMKSIRAIVPFSSKKEPAAY